MKPEIYFTYLCFLKGEREALRWLFNLTFDNADSDYKLLGCTGDLRLLAFFLYNSFAGFCIKSQQ